jgi:hypothetical protein
MSDDLFLTDEQVVKLTGCKLKSRQIAWLKAEGVPFRVNATGHPVVTRAAVEGRKPAEEPPQEAQRWTPRVIARGA